MRAALLAVLVLFLAGCATPNDDEGGSEGNTADPEVTCSWMEVEAGCLQFLAPPPEGMRDREATIAVDPRNPDHIAIAWTREPITLDIVASQRAVIAESHDAGNNWSFEELFAQDGTGQDVDSYDGSIHFMPDGRLLLVHGSSGARAITAHLRSDGQWTPTVLEAPFSLDAPHGAVLNDGRIIVVAHGVASTPARPIVSWVFDGAQWSDMAVISVDGVPVQGSWPRLAAREEAFMSVKQIDGGQFKVRVLSSPDGVEWTDVGAPFVKQATWGEGNANGSPLAVDSFGRPVLVIAAPGIPVFHHRSNEWSVNKTEFGEEEFWSSADAAVAPDGTVHALVLSTNNPFLAVHMVADPAGQRALRLAWTLNESIQGRTEYGGIDLGPNGTVWMAGVAPVDHPEMVAGFTSGWDERVFVVRVD